MIPKSLNPRRSKQLLSQRSVRQNVVPLLAGVLLLAIALRFWHLDAKPLWIDELYTAFYSLGKNPAEVPFGELQPLAAYRTLLSLPPDSTVWSAARAVTLYSNHPPLFFMLMWGWIKAVGASVYGLRSLAAGCGVATVLAGFFLGRMVGGPKVALLTAALMAVSPFGVYLSQEARHYTLPLLISTLALMAWLRILRSLTRGQTPNLTSQVAWVLLNGLGFYTHYFYLLGVFAQWLTTVLFLFRQRLSGRAWGRMVLLMGLTGLCYLPWLPTILQHFQSEGGTGWLSTEQPLWQAILLPPVRSWVAWVMMVILLPVEQMPEWVTLPAGALMLVIWVWVFVHLRRGWRSFTAGPSLSFWLLVGYIGLTVLEILAIAYGLGKDITVAPRYFFILYAALSAVMAAGLSKCASRVPAVVLSAGIVSALLVGWNLTLFKPYLPEKVSQRWVNSGEPLAVLMAAPAPQQRMLGLSYALAMPPQSTALLGFTEYFPEAADWQPTLAGLDQLPPPPLTLWLLEAHRLISFPTGVDLPGQKCLPVGELIVTEGTRQQQYRCESAAG
ncbi:glycosyltransferase family 39 protein [Romeria aff. gracilis LEGE 07310]|uniref:Glycosyltransferase family 39 protein n=1 Tax=Vasconcelosia minhoensis LEGE 07310 TaxID=915328 RepID=A0A8J7AD32_9CYAN|nr:glycosyltransferase family 39 protein [Romeria gracilis]MBE9077891.1 glycosyltransferase family 39 protein [Romeria aff. gracilis LEGE 07310]